MSRAHYTLKHLRYLVSVADKGSITAAAQGLRVSQPSLSIAIGQLEDRFGVTLFVRHQARGLALTPAGRRLVAAARNLLKEAERFDHFALELSDEVVGTAEIGCILTLAPVVMPALMAGFTAAHPKAELNCHERDHLGLIEELHGGALELAVMFDLGIPGSIAFAPLMACPVYALVPPGHALAERAAVSIAELADEPMILLDLPHSAEYFRQVFWSSGRSPRVAYRTQSPEMARSMVANGLGYTLFNTPFRNDRAVDGRAVRRLAIVDDVPPLMAGVAMLHDHKLPRIAEVARAHLMAATATGGEGQAPLKGQLPAGAGAA
ncbi:LysR family transcriptional regulator [Ancylobacter mangrovi]|uniref:LysR family transcriptional regulator n=1 Tax=Ancylobacter mangrovi TaxID=2972472 RepID=UPI0021628DBA|nr:LysR family transcriptional regulator [Ancylobacter mangrovi]MCS0505123.1 LysR family transcriptional regulator [Ancylobacter mangrovi]